MPFPNEHAARLRDPNDMDLDSFRRTAGGRRITAPGTEQDFVSVEVPDNIDIIWAKLRGKAEPADPPLAQALRFPTKDWTEAQARKWLADNKIKPQEFEPATGTEAKTTPKGIHTPGCFATHMGLWMVEPHEFGRIVEAVKAGAFPMKAAFPEESNGEFQPGPDENGLALVPLFGPMTKGASKYEGASTVMTRLAVKDAARNPDVRAIMLHVDSPGGMVAGTAELADEVSAASRIKPVHAHIDDMAASAAYWVASQATKVTANRLAQVGSIGTVAVVEDTSGAAELAGVKVHVISTGKHKGGFVDGAPVTKDQLADLQERVDGMNEHFLAAVSAGRGMSMGEVRKLADGRVHLAEQALALGLIDEISSLEDAYLELARVSGLEARKHDYDDESGKRRMTASAEATVLLGRLRDAEK